MLNRLTARMDVLRNSIEQKTAAPRQIAEHKKHFIRCYDSLYELWQCDAIDKNTYNHLVNEYFGYYLDYKDAFKCR